MVRKDNKNNARDREERRGKESLSKKKKKTEQKKSQIIVHRRVLVRLINWAGNVVGLFTGVRIQKLSM